MYCSCWHESPRQTYHDEPQKLKSLPSSYASAYVRMEATNVLREPWQTPRDSIDATNMHDKEAKNNGNIIRIKSMDGNEVELLVAEGSCTVRSPISDSKSCLHIWPFVIGRRDQLCPPASSSEDECVIQAAAEMHSRFGKRQCPLRNDDSSTLLGYIFDSEATVRFHSTYSLSTFPGDRRIYISCPPPIQIHEVNAIKRHSSFEKQNIVHREATSS